MSIILILPGAKVLLDCLTVLRCIIKALAVSYRRDICSRLLQPVILRGEQEASLHRSVQKLHRITYEQDERSIERGEDQVMMKNRGSASTVPFY